MKYVFAIILSLAGFAAFADGAPPKIYIDKNVCPFECCHYGDWKVIKNSKVFKDPESKIGLGEIKKGETVATISGDVHSVPYEVTVTDGEVGKGPQKGDKIYLLTPLGEGSWRVWEKGKVTEWDSSLTDFDKRSAKTPRQSSWWIQVKMKNGTTGWVKEDGQFDGADMDSCS
jgi:hypothetical protein